MPIQVMNDKGRYRQEYLMMTTFLQRPCPVVLYLPDLTKKWLRENAEGRSRIIEANVLYHSLSLQLSTNLLELNCRL